MTNAYLLEIGLEEMPADVILPALHQLSEKIAETCRQHQLPFTHLQGFSSPRRLAVLVQGLPLQQPDQVLELKGPPAQMAKEADGRWSKAVQGFAQKNGVGLEALTLQNFQGKEFVFAKKEIQGKPTRTLLAEHAPAWITGLSFPKNMRWGAYKLRYVRPIRWLVSLWNQEILPIQLEMIQAGAITHGHRFLNPEPIRISQAQDYFETLRSGHVLADYDQRRALILQQIRQIEAQHGFQVVVPDDLLQEVTNLVEWPTALLGSFEPEFLEIPSEVLVTTMAKNQRYFSIRNAQGQLLPHFITVRNGNTQALEVIARGNAKVLRARLSDARFFYQDDQKHPLEFFTKKAENVVFFQKRGSQAQRVERITQLSASIAQTLGFSAQQQHMTARIAALCKFDLNTHMVYEFPELQGTMGQYYARLQGEAEIVSRGIQQHYCPRHAQDQLPKDRETLPIALADKLDLLVTAFSLGITASGSADPYALRRMAQGVMQIILGAKLPLTPATLVEQALQILDQQQSLGLDHPKLNQDIQAFFVLRQRFMMQEAGIRYDVIEALLQSKALLPIEQMSLAEHLKSNLETPAFKLGVEAIVRASNLATKEAKNLRGEIEINALSMDEERALAQAVAPLPASPLMLEEYVPTLFRLQPLVTAFFEKVLVMDSDPTKRNNRLLLCQTLAEWSCRYLDLREIVFSGEGR